MNKKTSLMLCGLLLSTTQQFFASVSSHQVAVRLKAFQVQHKEQELQSVRSNYDSATDKLVELLALQRILAENEIKKVGHFPSVEYKANQIKIGYGRVWVNENLLDRISRVLKEEETEATCCCPRSYPRYDKDCDLSVVFARVQKDLEAERKPFEEFLKSQSNKQSDNR